MILIGILFFVILIMACGGVSILSIKNTILDMEGLIESQYMANKETFNLMWDSVLKKSYTTELQAEKFKNEFINFIFGKDFEPEKLLNSIKEQNPHLNSSLVTELQRVISVAKKNCSNNQIAIAERITEYNKYIQKHTITNMLLNRQMREVELRFYPRS